MSHTTESQDQSPSRCAFCNNLKRTTTSTKNLVVGIDGTSNNFGQHNTNVVKLLDMIKSESSDMDTPVEQCSYYLSGIGTRPTSLGGTIKEAIADAIDVAFAWNIGENVKNAYAWLAEMYEEGDQIYLFGFSRGAYQVQMLAGMIYEVGLIRTPMESQIEMAYGHYQAILLGKPNAKEYARRFKGTFSRRDARAHFVGVWDTVSSEGFIRGHIFHPSAAYACYFRHALALDERRVKFMPEYLHNADSHLDGNISKYIVTPQDSYMQFPKDEWREFVGRNAETDCQVPRGKSQIKEVWFAGSHSDVGGMDEPGQLRHAGKISLLWMHREAAVSGLALSPTDIVWASDDLDFGISNSMNGLWRVIEYVPIRHQVSTNKVSRRWHRMQPRRIIPGQKVHASVLYANVYRPKAIVGMGWQSIDVEPDDEMYSSMARKLVRGLYDRHALPMDLEGSLFMLQSEEGKRHINDIKGLRARFPQYICECTWPLTKLVAIVAYYEVSCDPQKHHTLCVPPENEIPEDIFGCVRDYVKDILAKHEHRDVPRVASLLRSLTKHRTLCSKILQRDVLDQFVNLLDVIVKQPSKYFGHIMDGLSCMLRCEDTRETLIESLGTNLPNSNIPRVIRILGAKKSRLLTSALHVVSTLAQNPDESTLALCSAVKPRLKELARKDEQPVGPLAVEILLSLGIPDDSNQLNLNDTNVRVNLAHALMYSNFQVGASQSSNDRDDIGRRILCQLFDTESTPLLSQKNKNLIGHLIKCVQKGSGRECDSATVILLELCKGAATRTYLLTTQLSHIFVSLMQRKDSALLAAYALAIFLGYDDMNHPIIQSHADLPKHIVGMLRLGYFNDAVGGVEGFRIFGDLMQHVDLRGGVYRHRITSVLYDKLGEGRPRETRTSMICLNIFHAYDPNGPWIRELAQFSVADLKSPKWNVQRVAVAVLSALAQTKWGVEEIIPLMSQVVDMLVPEGYATPCSTSVTRGSNESEIQSTLRAQSLPPSQIMGPACALRILALHPKLRRSVGKAAHYATLKSLYLCETLFDHADTPAWHVWTPNRADVTRMLDKAIKTIEKETSDYLTVRDVEVPYIAHWDSLIESFGSRALFTLGIVAATPLVIAAAVVGPPISWIYKRVKGLLSRRENSRYLDEAERRTPATLGSPTTENE